MSISFISAFYSSLIVCMLYYTYLYPICIDGCALICTYIFLYPLNKTKKNNNKNKELKKTIFSDSDNAKNRLEMVCR